MIAAPTRAGQTSLWWQVVGLLFGLVSAAVADQRSTQLSAEDLVQTMTSALRELNYEGTFVHVAGDKITSLRIVHANHSGKEMERLTALDGAPREVLRTDSLVTSIWPGTGPMDASRSRTPLARLEDIATMSEQYRLTDRGHDRVAGRSTRVIEVHPQDSLRYGHRLWIDDETRMLLRSSLLDENQDAVEQVVFTTISFPAQIDSTLFTADSVVAAERQASSSAQAIEAEQAAVSDHIHFQTLPAGYREVSEHFRENLGSRGKVSHAMLTDGMASVSVYVEHDPEPDRATGAEGHSSMGGMNAYGMALDGVFVTVVGDVPAMTVRLIAAATRFRQ